MIQIQQLSKKYRASDRYSVNGLDLTIGDGEVFGLLGPNGAGKTTLISMLCALIKPTSGGFTVNGLTYAHDKQAIQRLIGVVPQEYALYPSLTARENLIYFGSMYGLRGPILKNTIQRYLSMLGLLPFADKRAKVFSGGMKRRLNLIAAILHDPKILFLDEPTVGVDVQSRTAIIDHLEFLNKDQGTTIVYTSHHLNEAERFCTEVAIIDHGRLVCQGTPKNLIAQWPEAYSLEDVFLAQTGKALRDHV